jgi:TonB family protein
MYSLKLLQAVLLPVAFAVCALPCPAQAERASEEPPPPAAEYNPKNWKEFMSAEGRFSVLPPDGPAADSGQSIGGGPAPGDPKGQSATEAQTEGEVYRLLKQLREKGEDAGIVVGAKDDAAPPSSTATEEGGVLSGKILEKPAPVYPPIARAARVQGTVVVLILVDEAGKVRAAQAESGHPLLQAAAVKAVRGWTFSPMRLDGRPVKLMGTVTVNFTLQ